MDRHTILDIDVVRDILVLRQLGCSGKARILQRDSEQSIDHLRRLTIGSAGCPPWLFERVCNLVVIHNAMLPRQSSRFTILLFGPTASGDAFSVLFHS